jgi:DNA-binding response OmpR family regulator
MNPKIMIVDDEPEICEAVDHYFSRRGYCVVTAQDGEEALAKFINERPAFVLLDIRLPGMDGVECLRLMKQLDADVPVIMVTCVSDVGVARQAISLGAMDYITKPFGLEVIERLIMVYLFFHSPVMK